jgi:HSP20 family protein
MTQTTEKQESKQEITPSEKGQEIQKAAPTRALSPIEEMDRMFEAMDRLFEGYFPRRWLRALRREWPLWGELAMPFEGRLPHVDILDRDEEIVVRAAIPGVEKKDIDVSITENTVTIKGITSHEEKEEKGDYYRREIARGSFTRTFSLPGEVDSSKAEAKFKDGVLELTLPKVATSKRRTIKVE